MNAHALQFLITQRNFLAATFKLKSDKCAQKLPYPYMPYRDRYAR